MITGPREGAGRPSSREHLQPSTSGISVEQHQIEPALTEEVEARRPFSANSTLYRCSRDRPSRATTRLSSTTRLARRPGFTCPAPSRRAYQPTSCELRAPVRSPPLACSSRPRTAQKRVAPKVARSTSVCAARRLRRVGPGGASRRSSRGTSRRDRRGTRRRRSRADLRARPDRGWCRPRIPCHQPKPPPLRRVGSAHGGSRRALGRRRRCALPARSRRSRRAARGDRDRERRRRRRVLRAARLARPRLDRLRARRRARRAARLGPPSRDLQRARYGEGARRSETWTRATAIPGPPRAARRSGGRAALRHRADRGCLRRRGACAGDRRPAADDRRDARRRCSLRSGSSGGGTRTRSTACASRAPPSRAGRPRRDRAGDARGDCAEQPVHLGLADPRGRRVRLRSSGSAPVVAVSPSSGQGGQARPTR